jgi:hypothetical protein
MKLNFYAIKEKLLPDKENCGNELSAKDKTILDHIEKIVEISKKAGAERV